MTNMLTRRQLLRAVAVTSATAAVPCTKPLEVFADETSPQWSIAIFEKVFEGLTYDELADAISEIGADGVEATIRPGGHIEPAVAETEVPKMQSAMQARGKRIVIAATHIRSVDEPHTESLLKIFRSLGITHYRMGHYYLDPKQPFIEQVSQYASMARDLAALNQEIGVQGLYQNHAGKRFLGALGWDIAYMLRGIDPDGLGVACDLRHLRADTGTSWQTAVRAMKPHLRSIYIKDAAWRGPRTDQLKNVPVDTGFVTDEIFEFVRKGVNPMPLCIHMEHLGYRVFERHEIPAAIKAHQEDIKALRRWMES